jgi:hypothetical protein
MVGEVLMSGGLAGTSGFLRRREVYSEISGKAIWPASAG